MKVSTLVNGVVRIALTPESEIEKALLQALFVGPVEVTIHEKLVIMDKSLSDTVIIAPAAIKKIEE